MMNLVITVLYFNGRVYEENDGVIFEGGKYVALLICDDEDVETMIESFQQQEQMSVLKLYIKKDVVGGSMFHFTNNESEPPRNVSNLHDDEDDDDNYLVSNSYVEKSLDDDDSVDGISDTDDEFTDIIQLVPKEFKIHFEMMFCIITISIGVILIRKTFVVWRCLRVLMLGKNYMLAWILTVKMRCIKVLKLLKPNHTNISFVARIKAQSMIRKDPSTKVSLIQERINSEFTYKVSYQKEWMAKQKAIAIEYGNWKESYMKLSSWLKHMQNHSLGSYFQILHDDFIVRTRVGVTQ
ncbi:hypothetical protein HKD37_17G047911 [Glycine soja]